MRGAEDEPPPPPVHLDQSGNLIPDDEDDSTTRAVAGAPAMPTDVRFQKVTSTSIQLIWVNRDASASPVISYRRENAASYSRYTAKVGITSITLTPVSASDRWQFFVQACRSTVCSDPTDEYSTVPDPRATVQVITEYENCARAKQRDFYAPNSRYRKVVESKCPVRTTRRFDKWEQGQCNGRTSTQCTFDVPSGTSQISHRVHYVTGGTAGADWRVAVLVYDKIDVRYTDGGVQKRFQGQLTADERDRATQAANAFFGSDVPALTGGYMVPRWEVSYPGTLTSVTVTSGDLKTNCGVAYPKPEDIVRSGQAMSSYDALIVIYPGTGRDERGTLMQLQRCGLADYTGLNQTHTSVPIGFIPADPSNPKVAADRNQLKHEFGHNLLFYYAAKNMTNGMQASGNHINYIPDKEGKTNKWYNCATGRPYDLRDENERSKIPNSIYNNNVGFTRDYYSGTTKAEGASACAGVSLNAWKSGGPVTRP